MADLAVSIFDKLEIESISSTNIAILLSALQIIANAKKLTHLQDLIQIKGSLFVKLQQLSDDEWSFLNTIYSQPGKTVITIDECQLLVQKQIPQARRKALAAYYTNNEGLQLIAALVTEYDEKMKKPAYIISDPFMGAARTLRMAIQILHPNKIQQVIGIEPYFLAALVGYAAVLDALQGNDTKISIFLGDAFQIISQIFSPPTLLAKSFSKVDIILTNPPYTRWKYLTLDQRKTLIHFAKSLGYGEYISRNETGLQVFSMFLCDYILKKGGLVAAVLPLSNFYIIGGQGYKGLLRTQYHLLGLIDSSQEAAFSEDSGFKEIVLIAEKIAGNETQNAATFFGTVKNQTRAMAKALIQRTNSMPEVAGAGNYYNIKQIPAYLDTNWLPLFDPSPLAKALLQILSLGLNNHSMGYWHEIFGENVLVRGFEMYGPDFFFLPNKYWRIQNIATANDSGSNKNSETSMVAIVNCETDQHLILPRDFLIPSLRKPGLYYNTIIPNVDIFCLAVPNQELSTLPRDVQSYITWGSDSSTAAPAIKAFGSQWYSHIYRCLQIKQPYGKVFMGDKVDLVFKNRSVFANYSPVPVTASKNFYLCKDLDDNQAKILCAWLNSSIFLSMIIVMSRKISQTWTRLLENDYLELPLLNFSQIPDNLQQNVLKEFEPMLQLGLPPIWEQMGNPQRLKLDIAIAKCLMIPDPEEFIRQYHKFILLVTNQYKKSASTLHDSNQNETDEEPESE